MKQKRQVNLQHARTDFQRRVMEQIQKDDVCPFCNEHFLKYHTKPILKRGKYWILTENFDPYPGSKHHLLAVSRTHVATLQELVPAARAELLALFAGECKKRGIVGGAVFMRFGDSDYSGATVEHLHAQMVSGGKGPKKESIVTRIGYAA